LFGNILPKVLESLAGGMELVRRYEEETIRTCLEGVVRMMVDSHKMEEDGAWTEEDH
jgi:hypothetical protein